MDQPELTEEDLIEGVRELSESGSLPEFIFFLIIGVVLGIGYVIDAARQFLDRRWREILIIGCIIFMLVIFRLKMP